MTTYALAGVAKLAGPLGWKWTSGESLRRQVAVDGVRKEAFGSAASPLAYKLYANVALFRVLALGSMAIELRPDRTRRSAPGATLGVRSVATALGNSGDHEDQVPLSAVRCGLCLVPGLRETHPPMTTVLIFDRYCGFCTRTVSWLLRLDRQNRLAALAIQAGCSNPAIAASRDQT